MPNAGRAVQPAARAGGGGGADGLVSPSYAVLLYTIYIRSLGLNVMIW